MKNLIDAGKTIIAIIFGLAFIGLFISTMSVTPDNAQVLVDPQKNVYYAPPYIADVMAKNPEYLNMDNLRLTSYITATTMAFDPDPECRDLGYFQQDERCVTLQILEKTGLLSPEISRWNPDGSWNW